jgi:hypothetical protein
VDQFYTQLLVLSDEDVETSKCLLPLPDECSECPPGGKNVCKNSNFVTAAPFREEAQQHFHATDWPFVLTVARRRATAKQKAGFVGSARERREPSLESTVTKSELLATTPFAAMFPDYSRR